MVVARVKENKGLDGSRDSIAEDHNYVKEHTADEIEFGNARIKVDNIEDRGSLKGGFERSARRFVHRVERLMGILEMRGLEH